MYTGTVEFADGTRLRITTKMNGPRLIWETDAVL
jgi:hypothetical protein